MIDEDIFKALADPSRRKLLDLLHERDGQTLLELRGHLPMTRFGCMSHLKILESAGLITSQRIGREKYHYLNPVPIQSIYDRWVSKYARPWTSALIDLKHKLEEKPMSDKPSHVFAVYIQTTPEKLWQAITDGEMTSKYFFGTRVVSDWTPGAAINYLNSSGKSMLTGEVLEIDPPNKLVTTFIHLWSDEPGPATRVTYEITKVGDSCKLTLTHDGLVAGSDEAAETSDGWTRILSGLKTYLETGAALDLSE